MYLIQVNGRALYSPSLVPAGYVAYNIVLSQELNEASSLEFTIPDTNPEYAAVKALQGFVTVYDGSELIFKGRVTNTRRDFYRQKEVHCESELAYLNDVVLRPYTFDGTVAAYFAYLVGQYNDRATASRQFAVGNVTVTDRNNRILRSNTQYPTIWAEIKEKLLDNLGGYISVRYANDTAYLDYTVSSGSTGDQVIRFGQNLIDLDDYVDGEETYTNIIPLGAETEETWPDGTKKRLTVASVNSGNDYISSTATATYGVIERVEDWEDVTVASNLKTKGTARLGEHDKAIQSISISAIDLHLLDVATERLKLGNTYHVVSPPHGFYADSADGLFPLTRIELNLTNPDQSVYTFGKARRTLTGG